MILDNSGLWWARAEKVLAGGPATLSKHPDRYARGITPIFLERGMGGHVWDVDNREYIDTVAGLGPILLGYHHPDVDMAVRQQLRDGPIFSLPHPLEVEVAEHLCEVIPSAEMVRFAKNGMDVTNAAVRLARFMTGRKHVLCSGYHGGADFYMASTDKAGGILPEIGRYTHQFTFGHSGAFQRLVQQHTQDLGDSEIAAIMLEIPPRPWGEPLDIARAFLEEVQNTCRLIGAVFILDEVVTGFREALGGAQSIYALAPDLTCLSKGMANGFPISALVGKRELMRGFDGGQVFFSTTFGGDAIGLAAAHATLQVLRRTDALETLHARGQMIGANLAEAIKYHDVPCDLLGNSARMTLKFRDLADVSGAAMKTLFLQETIKKSVIFGGPLFPMSMHTEDDAHYIIEAADHGFRIIRQALMSGDFMRHLECPVIEDVFAARYPGNREPRRQRPLLSDAVPDDQIKMEDPPEG